MKIIYYGKYSEEFKHENPEISDVEAQMNSLHSQVNLRDDIIEGRNDMLIEMKKFSEEMVGQKQGGFLGILKRRPEADQPPQ